MPSSEGDLFFYGMIPYGVRDLLDRCPDTARLKKLPNDFHFREAVNPLRLEPGLRAWPVDRHGCELDTDHDGVVNSLDYCPEDTAEMLAKGVAPNGCPLQSDQDGTPDYRDDCPGTPKGVPTDNRGCPIKKGNPISPGGIANLLKKKST